MDKDRQFGKKTTFKIIDFIIESGVSLVPGGTIPYNAIKKIIEVAKDYHNFKTEQKIHQFHIALLNGENMDEFSNKECDIDDYTSLLNCCLQDIEDEKAEIYGKFLKGLIENNSILKEARRRMILLIKEFSMSDILLLKKIYIHLKYNLTNKPFDIKNLINNQSPEIKMSKNKFVYYSLIDVNNDYIDDFIFSFLETIFSKDELTPESIGRKEWKHIRVCIISSKLGDAMHTKLATDIQDLCYKDRMTSDIIALTKNQINPAQLMCNVGVVILDDSVISQDYVDRLNNFAEKRPLFILNIGKFVENNFQQIKSEKVINLGNPDNIKSIYSEIIKEYAQT